MDDLISRKDTIDFIKKGTQGYHEQGYKTAVLDILDLIDQQDTAFNLENVIAVKALEELEQYRSIGTVSECRDAVEKQRAKKPDLYMQ